MLRCRIHNLNHEYGTGCPHCNAEAEAVGIYGAYPNPTPAPPQSSDLYTTDEEYGRSSDNARLHGPLRVTSADDYARAVEGTVGFQPAKNCPHCNVQPRYHTEPNPRNERAAYLYSLSCANPNCSVRPFTGNYSRPSEAFYAWNNSISHQNQQPPTTPNLHLAFGPVTRKLAP